MSNILEAAEFLKSHDNIEIFTHIHPDGDTTGSSFALCTALLKLGKKAKVVCLDKFPENLSYIHSLEMPEFEAETTVSVDVAARSLLGKDFPEDKTIHLAIDHHLNNTTDAELLVCDHRRSAAGELIYELILALGVELDRYIAEALYTAISTDTGCFRFSNTTRRTFEIAGHLCDFAEEGSFGYLNTPLFITKSQEQLRLEANILANLDYYFDSRVCVSVISSTLYETLGVSENDAAGIEQLAKVPKGVELGITLKERLGGYKVSMRSSDNIDASVICANFGGGGHHSASGCFIKGTKNEVLDEILEYIEESNLFI